MATQRTRFQVWLDPLEAQKVTRWAEAQEKTVSAALGFLVLRGLEQEVLAGLNHLHRVCDATGQQVELLQGLFEALETREAERFRRLLGHLQHHQALTSELVCGLRVTMGRDQPGDYEQALETARRQVTEDAAVFRESIALAGPGRRPESVAKKRGRVA